MKIFIIITFLLTALSSYDIITPIKTLKINKAKAKLGMDLFFDSSFSKDGKISCASCHQPGYGWADPRKVSVGIYGRKGVIQSPTVLNAVYNFKQMWNGRFKDLYEQINGPTHDSSEMGTTNEHIEKIINKEPYKSKFQKIYKKDYNTYKMFQDAIVEFEKFLTTPDSKFDLYLKGKDVLSKDEKRGYELFVKTGCIVCHNGKNVGGNNFSKIGVVNNKKMAFVRDRYSITHKKIDIHVYKVPSLRNIALTSPYFHTGDIKDLKVAIRTMGYMNLGVDLDDKQVELIYKFLLTLTGKSPDIGSLR